jgi:predicted Zn finger-like uncharacterized protein
MIIECEKCKSKFKLDEGLLREEGTKVRCSQCKHVFKAYPSSLSPEEPDLKEIEDFEEASTIETTAGSGPEGEEPIAEIYKDYGEDLGERAESIEGALSRLDLDRDTEKEAISFERRAEPVVGVEQVAKAKPREWIPEKPKKATRPSGVRKPGRSPVLPVILIVVVLLLGGATAVYFFAPQYIPESVVQFLPFLKGAERRETTDPGIRRLSFKAITGHFAESSKAGQLFVVKGIVANNYSSSRSYILVKGSILDDKGKVVRTKLAYAGNSFTDDEIKQLSQDQINQAMRNRPGKGDMNLNVKPQAAIPFMVIFDELPDNLSEFTVEAVSSSPGK